MATMYSPSPVSHDDTRSTVSWNDTSRNQEKKKRPSLAVYALRLLYALPIFFFVSLTFCVERIAFDVPSFSYKIQGNDELKVFNVPVDEKTIPAAGARGPGVHITARPIFDNDTNVSNFLFETLSPLHEGFVLDAETGVISGSFGEINSYTVDKNTYTITVIARARTRSSFKGRSTSTLMIGPLQFVGLHEPYKTPTFSYTIPHGKLSMHENVHQIAPLARNLKTKANDFVFRAETALPEGLKLNTNEVRSDIFPGAISGTPKKSGRFTVTISATAKDHAKNKYDRDHTRITVLIIVSPVTPSFSYNRGEVALLLSGSSINIPPHFARGKASDFTFKAELPKGLKIDPNSGLISGKLQNESPEKAYVVSATVRPEKAKKYSTRTLTTKLRIRVDR